MTSQMQTTLLTHMFALCLRVDDYATDSSLVAKDLGMQPSEYVLTSFSALGNAETALQSEQSFQVAGMQGRQFDEG